MQGSCIPPAPSHRPGHREHLLLTMPAMCCVHATVLASARCLYNPETKLLIRKYEEVMRSLDPTWEPHPLVKSAREYLERMYPVTNDKTVETVRECVG